jgi:hypothetical protein
MPTNSHSHPPLARTRDGHPFTPPRDTVAWRVRKDLGPDRRPGVVWTAWGVLYLAPDATAEQLRRAVRGRPGRYLLYPVDANGGELEPVAVLDLPPTPDSPDTPDPPDPSATRPPTHRSADDHLASRVHTQTRVGTGR